MDFNKIKEALDEMIKNLEKEDEEVVKSSKNAKKTKALLMGLTAEMIESYTTDLTVGEFGDVCTGMSLLWEYIPVKAAEVGIKNCADSLRTAAMLALSEVEESD